MSSTPRPISAAPRHGCNPLLPSTPRCRAASFAADTADIDPVEAAYIKSALAAVNRTTTPWIIAGGHRPLYCTNSDKVQCGLFPVILRMQIEDAFYTNGVDLVITCEPPGD